MSPPKLVVAALSGLAVLGGGASLAQTPDAASGLYSPKAAVQSPPLRVEVIDGTRFRDIETHAVYRLYGIDTCAPDQTAQRGRQPWPCCQSAFKFDPVSASNFDPLERLGLAVALVSSELAGIAETRRARVA